MSVECRQICVVSHHMPFLGGRRSARGHRRLRGQMIHSLGQLARRRGLIDGQPLRLAAIVDVGVPRCQQLCGIAGRPSTLGLCGQHSLSSRGIRRLGCMYGVLGVTQQTCGVVRLGNLASGGSRWMSRRGDEIRRELKGGKDLWICACGYRISPWYDMFSWSFHLLVKIYFLINIKNL